MQKWQLWVKTGFGTSTMTIVWADNYFAAKMLGEAQYGVGSVLNAIPLHD